MNKEVHFPIINDFIDYIVKELATKCKFKLAQRYLWSKGFLP